MNFLNFADMFDGGGAGAVGDTFQGGPLSGLLNAIGIRPMGYRQRHGLLSQEPSSMGRMGAAPTGLLSGAPSGPPLGTMPGAPTAATLEQGHGIPKADPVPEPLVAPTLPRVGVNAPQATPAMPQDVAAPRFGDVSTNSGVDEYRQGLAMWINQNYPGFASMPSQAQQAIVQAYGMGIR